MTSRHTQLPALQWDERRGLFRRSRRLGPLLRSRWAAALLAFALGFGLGAWIFTGAA